MSSFRIGRKLSEETRAKMSIAKAGKRPEGSGRPSQKVEVMDIKNNIKTRYDSISAAALALNIRRATIYDYLACNEQKVYKNKFIFKRL